MESVSSVSESSDLIVKVLLLLELSGGVSENLALILGQCKAHIIVQVSDELLLVEIVLLKELRLLSLYALHHNVIVRSGIKHAHGVHLLGLLEIRVAIVSLSS